jgi:hypothetical protein
MCAPSLAQPCCPRFPAEHVRSYITDISAAITNTLPGSEPATHITQHVQQPKCTALLLSVLSTPLPTADDSQMLLALAAVLVNTQGAFKAYHCATEFAKSYDQWRGYGGSSGQVGAPGM